jgi:Ran GTPase-activating protein (RanGAP) involved in mRNA processing and transport
MIENDLDSHLEILLKCLEIDEKLNQLQLKKQALLDKLKFQLCNQKAIFLNTLINNSQLENTSKAIGDAGWAMIEEFIPKNVQLLSVGFNELTAVSMVSIGDLLSHNGLQYLDLVSSNISLESLHSLERGFRLSTSLKTLVLSRNNLGDEGIKVLIDSLPKYLATLALDATNLSAKSVKLISHALLTHPLRALDLSMNSITDECISFLCKGVSHSNLYTLDLHANDIGNNGLILMGKMLVLNKSLYKLSLEENAFDDQGVMEFCRIIEENDALDFDYFPSALNRISFISLGVLVMSGNSLDVGIERLIQFQSKTGILVELDDVDVFHQAYHNSISTLTINEKSRIVNISNCYRMFRNLIMIDLPIDLKIKIISDSFPQLFIDDSFHIIKRILFNRRFIGDIYDEYPYDSRALERLCFKLVKTKIE